MKYSLSEKRNHLNKIYFGKPFQSPGKGVVAFFLLVWIISCSLMVLAMTNLFQESFFNRKNIIGYLLLTGATVSVFRVCMAYYKKGKQK